MKKCGICGKEKKVDEFGLDKNSPGGRRYLCKTCRREKERLIYQRSKSKHAKTQKKYKDANREKIRAAGRDYYSSHKEDYARRGKSDVGKAAAKKYREGHKEDAAEYHKIYQKEHADELREKSRIYQRKNYKRLAIKKREWASRNRQSLREKHKIRQRKHRKNNLSVRLLENARSRVYAALKGKVKSAKTMELIGCTIEYLKTYLESQFVKGMKWDNYGRYGWHIDHIIPCAVFDMSNHKEQKECFHFSNLQPLWAEDNLRKSNKVA